ncbi:helix-turn-helix domain-containing protein [Bradyrhizobium sp. AUGA SZCCT0182]|uniref:helix-turn-helix domain-containing protein n=1 Tax=Bradyrhizobium sp. AUGA SZCCT0182 TaxID=2807667 RepID=UPI001BAA1BF1|nr:helix-turn-helix domain-containing protein [Bradyrhizobium sp. AUGA SZCCT0182]MBR1234611.1 helix-turn-helix domain-containing protein [Bradyrhizobium sp. AUGA SZCCT0182]
MSVVEGDLILETLAHTHGNRTVTVQLLGVSVRSLRNKISEYSAKGFTSLVTKGAVRAPKQ